MGIYGGTNESSQGGFRNLLLNGALNHWQRGDGPYTMASATDIWTGFYFGSCDRWGISSSTGNSQQFLKKVTSPIDGFTFVATLPDSGAIMQIIENGSSRMIPGKTYTASIWSNGPLDYQLGTTGAVVNFSTGPRKVVETHGNWSRYATTFTVNDVTGSSNLKVFLVNNSGAEVMFTGTQLEEGPVATAFEQIDPSLELRMCRRYCMRVYEYNQVTQENNGDGSTSLHVNYSFPVQMVATPTVVNASTNYTANWQFTGYTASPTSLRINGTSIGGYGYRDLRYQSYFAAAEIKD